MPDKKSSGTEAQPSSLELTEELIRKRAYYFYEQRGRKVGHDLEDWFRAEAEIIGRKTRGYEAAQKETRRAGA